MNRPTRKTDGSSSSPADKRQHQVPPGTGTFGMFLFLLALGILFAASIVGYVIIRMATHGDQPLGSIDLPGALWVSTAIILVSSYTIHRALQSVRHERQTAFRNSMTITLLLAVGFLVVQVPSLSTLLAEHWLHVERTEDGGFHSDEGFALYGLIFFLITVHALHVLGGLVPLVLTTYKAHASRYDHEHHAPVRYLAMYWHFLDGVWIVMFATLIFAA